MGEEQQKRLRSHVGGEASGPRQALSEKTATTKNTQAGTIPYTQWNVGLGHLICQIRRPGPKWEFSKTFSQALP